MEYEVAEEVATAPRIHNTYRTGTLLIDKFLVHVEKTCAEHDIELYLSESERVSYGGVQCTGYFDPRPKRLALALDGHVHGGGPEVAPWLPTLAHEFSHMTQWIDKCEAWQTMFFDELVDQVPVG